MKKDVPPKLKNLQNIMSVLYLLFGIMFVFPPSIPVIIILAYSYFKKNPISKSDLDEISKDFKKTKEIQAGEEAAELPTGDWEEGTQMISFVSETTSTKLDKKKKYLQIALNGDLYDAENIIRALPSSERIIIEAGTPLIKRYGTEAVRKIKDLSPIGTYIVADSKISDLAEREVEMMNEAGASAITCLGVAPVETINKFLKKCEELKIDSMIDMMNVEDPLSILKKLKILPKVVILHRGVDEGEYKKEKTIPYYQIKQVKGNFNIMVSVAGGDTQKEIESAIFNDADIVVLWKNFFQSDQNIANLTESFLSVIK